MRIIAIIMTLLIVVTSTTFAANLNKIENRIQLATEGYLIALKSDNPGIRNSALQQLAVLKARYPNYDLTKVEKQVKKLSHKDSELLIRINANITYRYLTNRELTDKINIDNVDSKSFFKELYGQVSNIEKVY